VSKKPDENPGFFVVPKLPAPRLLTNHFGFYALHLIFHRLPSIGSYAQVDEGGDPWRSHLVNR
jgi:hypothetical protein